MPFFQTYRLSEITVEAVDNYRAAKLREKKALSANSINKTLKILAKVLESAVEYGYLSSNPARGRNRRLKASRPRRTWLELDEVRTLLDAAGPHRPILATMVLAGLRVGELTALRWRDVDLPRMLRRLSLLPCWQQETPLSGAFRELRGKDSNLDYLIQSHSPCVLFCSV